jgi:hypothetical protein
MQVRTDDEVYRVDAVWLGPPGVRFFGRLRYVSWGIGVLTFLAMFLVLRLLGMGIGMHLLLTDLIVTATVTRLVGRYITYDRPFRAVAAMFLAELRTPRSHAGQQTGVIFTERVRARALSTHVGTARRRRVPAMPHLPAVHIPHVPHVPHIPHISIRLPRRADKETLDEQVAPPSRRNVPNPASAQDTQDPSDERAA